MKKKLRDFVNRNVRMLEESDKSLKAVYDVTAGNGDLVIAETFEDFRIRKYTYRETDGLVKKAAAGIYDRIGATHDYVALEMENGMPWIVAFWAILMSGNKPYLVNCRHPESLSNGILSTLGIRYIIALNEGRLKGEYIAYDSLFSSDTILPEGLFENELAMSTSATSMNEVICFYTGRQISAQILCVDDILKRSERVSLHYHGSLKLLAFLPFYHVFGLFAVYFWFTFFGRTVVFMKDYSGDTILNTCRRHEVTHIFAVPMLWHTIEQEIRNKLDSYPEKKKNKFYKGLRFCTSLQNLFPIAGSRISMKIMHEVTDQLFGDSVRFCISGGSYIRQSALELFNGLGYALHNGYGMTETGITAVELRSKAKYRNQNSIGAPLSAVGYRISEDGSLLVKSATRCGRIMINGVTLENTEWFDTGDVACEKDGYYYIKGRKSDVVIGENGENVDPDVIEQMFDLKEAQTFSVLGLSDGTNDKLSLVVQIDRKMPADAIAALCSKAVSINESLPVSYRVNRFFVTRDAIAPENSIKVSRTYLRRKIADHGVRLVPFSEVSGMSPDDGYKCDPAIAGKLRTIISDVLGIPEEDISDGANIMLEYGATSLQYFSILARIADEFNVTDYTDKGVFCYSVNEFGKYLEDREKGLK